jgi:bifunctional non-homologous end joining protein LigD
LELSARHEAAGEGDAPWPPNYAKQAGEPPRVQPSRKRRDDADYVGRGMEGGPPPEVQAERAAAVAAGDRNAGLPTDWTGSRPTPTGRRRTSVPVIEISRAAHKDEALAGLDRWKERHPDAAAHLEAADVLVDGMRGRSSLWYRVRVNLIHVPEADRPGQEPLDPDYDPWAGFEWPDRSGQLERAPRKKTPKTSS